jgi:hypothetical protein
MYNPYTRTDGMNIRNFDYKWQRADKYLFSRGVIINRFYKFRADMSSSSSSNITIIIMSDITTRNIDILVVITVKNERNP